MIDILVINNVATLNVADSCPGLDITKFHHALDRHGGAHMQSRHLAAGAGVWGQPGTQSKEDPISKIYKIFPPATQNSMQFKGYKLFVSGIFHLVFLIY